MADLGFFFLNKLNLRPIPASRHGPLETGWFGLRSDVGKEFQILRIKPPSRRDDLTVHRCARGFREERDEQQIDEIDEGQGIVPEQASCRDKEENKHTFHHDQRQQQQLPINSPNATVLYGLFASHNI